MPTAFPALYLRDGEAIVAGSKTALVSATPNRYQPGTYELVVKRADGSYCVPGTVTLSEPLVCDAKALDARHKEHAITREQRLRWWPLAETFNVYALTFKAFAQPFPVQLASGVPGRVTLQGLGLTLLAQVDGCYLYEVE